MIALRYHYCIRVTLGDGSHEMGAWDGAPEAGEVLCFTRWIAPQTHRRDSGYITSLRSFVVHTCTYAVYRQFFGPPFMGA